MAGNPISKEDCSYSLLVVVVTSLLQGFTFPGLANESFESGQLLLQ